MTVFCLLYEKMLNAGMGNKFEFDKEIIMIPISDILIRSISGYVGTSDVFPDHVPALCRMAPLLAILPNGLPT